MIRIRSRSPLVGLALRRSRGYRQLCSLWFEYDLCLNRKPPNDLETFLTTLIRIRSKSDQKGLSYDSNTIQPPNWSLKQDTNVWVVLCNRLSLVPWIFSENSNLREINSFWTRTLNRIWELQSFVGDKFPLNRILNLNPSFKPEILCWPSNFPQ